MKRILILGGGVGGTLTANLLVKKLRRQLKTGEVTVTVVDQTGQHTYQPGFIQPGPVDAAASARKDAIAVAMILCPSALGWAMSPK